MLAASGVTSLVAAIGVAALMAATPANAQDKVVYINSSGGVLDDINRKIQWASIRAGDRDQGHLQRAG